MPSNPSTELLDRVIASFRLVPGLENAALIVVCDGYTVAKRCNCKAGRISLEAAERYEAFVEALGQREVVLMRLEERQGFGWAVKSALEAVQTPFVLVVQHDQEFINSFELKEVLDCMVEHPEVKYVGLSSSLAEAFGS